jgi:hypothetical protein
MVHKFCIKQMIEIFKVLSLSHSVDVSLQMTRKRASNFFSFSRDFHGSPARWIDFSSASATWMEHQFGDSIKERFPPSSSSDTAAHSHVDLAWQDNYRVLIRNNYQSINSFMKHQAKRLRVCLLWREWCCSFVHFLARQTLSTRFIDFLISPFNSNHSREMKWSFSAFYLSLNTQHHFEWLLLSALEWGEWSDADGSSKLQAESNIKNEVNYFIIYFWCSNANGMEKPPRSRRSELKIYCWLNKYHTFASGVVDSPLN